MASPSITLLGTNDYCCKIFEAGSSRIVPLSEFGKIMLEQVCGAVRFNGLNRTATQVKEVNRSAVNCTIRYSSEPRRNVVRRSVMGEQAKTTGKR